MPIKGDTALSSFSGKELAESSAIHGDFNQASINYSGHQNLEVRAEGDWEDFEIPDMIMPSKIHWIDVRAFKDDDNDGYHYGILFQDEEGQAIRIPMYKTEEERDAELKKAQELHRKEYGDDYAETFAARGTYNLYKSQEKVLKAYRDSGGKENHYDSLPPKIVNKLESIRNSETLWSDVNRWLWDNPSTSKNPYGGFHSTWDAESFGAELTPRFIPVEVIKYDAWWSRKYGREYKS